jgi:ferredoxin
VEDDGRGSVRKCDLCGGHPACVEACATRALDFAAVDPAPRSKRKALADKIRLEGRER